MTDVLWFSSLHFSEAPSGRCYAGLLSSWSAQYWWSLSQILCIFRVSKRRPVTKRLFSNSLILFDFIPIVWRPKACNRTISKAFRQRYVFLSTYRYGVISYENVLIDSQKHPHHAKLWDVFVNTGSALQTLSPPCFRLTRNWAWSAGNPGENVHRGRDRTVLYLKIQTVSEHLGSVTMEHIV